jgi:hypothetical protein
MGLFFQQGKWITAAFVTNKVKKTLYRSLCLYERTNRKIRKES